MWSISGLLLTGETRFARRIACHSATSATTCIVELLNTDFRGKRPVTNSVGRSTLAAFGVKDMYAWVDSREQWAFQVYCIQTRHRNEHCCVISCNPRIHKKTYFRPCEFELVAYKDETA